MKHYLGSVLCVGAALASGEAFAQLLQHTSGSAAPWPTSVSGSSTNNYNAQTATDRIDSIVERAYRFSFCRQQKVKDGKDPITEDFLKGMSATMVRSLCGRSNSAVGSIPNGMLPGDFQKNTVAGVLTAPPGSLSQTDLIGEHKCQPDSKPWPYRSSGHEKGPQNTARVYGIMAALVMQESGGNIIEGEDASKSQEKKTKLEEEAGAVQQSANSQANLQKKPESEAAYQELLKSYKESILAAAGDLTKVDQICMTSKYTGNGRTNAKKAVNVPALLKELVATVADKSITSERQLKPEDFIVWNKNCPAFALEYGALMARTNFLTNGPLIRCEVEMSDGCEKMFGEIAELATKDPGVCASAAIGK